VSRGNQPTAEIKQIENSVTLEPLPLLSSSRRLVIGLVALAALSATGAVVGLTFFNTNRAQTPSVMANKTNVQPLPVPSQPADSGPKAVLIESVDSGIADSGIADSGNIDSGTSGSAVFDAGRVAPPPTTPLAQIDPAERDLVQSLLKKDQIFEELDKIGETLRRDSAKKSKFQNTFLRVTKMCREANKLSHVARCEDAFNRFAESVAASQ
jgi:hypothetical protein